MNLKPTGNKVLVEPFPPPEKSTGGIMLPTQYQLPSGVGRVLAVGPGKYNRKGVLVPVDLQPGDVVQYRWIDGREIEWDGKMLKILTTDELIGVNEAGENIEHSTSNIQHPSAE